MSDRLGHTHNSDSKHESLSAAAIKRDEQHFLDIYKHLMENMTNQFEVAKHPMRNSKITSECC